MSYELVMPGRTIIGEGALEQSIFFLKGMGKRAFIVTDEAMLHLKNVKCLEVLLQKCGIEYIIYSGINSEPTDRMVELGSRIYQKEKCDFLIALGGGSPIDAMKAIGILVSCGGKIADYLGENLSQRVPSMVAIPTTAGTGSEATQFAIITDTISKIKMLLKGSALLPQLAIVDPGFTMTVPPKITAATGLDALTHAIEAYTSKKASPLSDLYAISATKRIFKYLPIAFENGNDRKAREEMSFAAFEAGVAFNNASVTVVHGMSRPLGALFHVPHGISNAMLLDVCLSYIMDGAYQRFANLAYAIGVADESLGEKRGAFCLQQAVSRICKQCKIPSVREYGLDETEFFAHIDKMAEDALESGSPANTYKVLEKEDILEIYRNLWK